MGFFFPLNYDVQPSGSCGFAEYCIPQSRTRFYIVMSGLLLDETFKDGVIGSDHTPVHHAKGA